MDPVPRGSAHRRAARFPGSIRRDQARFRIVGPATMAVLLLEGRGLDARDALDNGLVTRIVRDAGLAPEARATGRRICKSSPLASRSHKQQIRRLTSVYFLTFAAAQMPIGRQLDRYEPRRVQHIDGVDSARLSVVRGVRSGFSFACLPVSTGPIVAIRVRAVHRQTWSGCSAARQSRP